MALGTLHFSTKSACVALNLKEKKIKTNIFEGHDPELSSFSLLRATPSALVHHLSFSAGGGAKAARTGTNTRNRGREGARAPDRPCHHEHTSLGHRGTDGGREMVDGLWGTKGIYFINRGDAQYGGGIPDQSVCCGVGKIPLAAAPDTAAAPSRTRNGKGEACAERGHQSGRPSCAANPESGGGAPPLLRDRFGSPRIAFINHFLGRKSIRVLSLAMDPPTRPKPNCLARDTASPGLFRHSRSPILGGRANPDEGAVPRPASTTTLRIHFRRILEVSLPPSPRSGLRGGRYGEPR